ncbi:DUF2254 domain-containing protein [Angustibacter sp. Root456]|uniref:DUF2254 domain-containing protein n=1 Tax=Angustibacter sp. Root456 TaxID=1736539 RepID=UPI0006F47687|nr:DUF2254 domain-containing protein [Angustibacter sp. Root456]KQX65751.1 hypothetical protein ASD06_09045 [Angustibacter sp. Root456]
MVGLWLRLRDSFWVVPALLCVGAVVLAEVVLGLDRHVDLGDTFVASVLNEAGASGSRDLLGAVAASMLSVAGTMFSITMAVLALTSSSYGPRLVRNFMGDRGNQVVLGTFLATFLYALIVLRTVRSSGDSGDRTAFVPHLAVTVAVVLAVVCVAVLVYFIHHISDSIQVATLSGRVRQELRETVERMYPAQTGRDVAAVADGESADRAADLPGDLSATTPVEAGDAGYVAAVDLAHLLRLGQDHDRVVVLTVRPGDHVLADDTVARIWPACDEARSDELASAVQRAVTVGRNRTPYQDVAFAVQQLVELAVRALSPGTNDPFTAQNALDDLTVGLALMAARPTPSARRYDDQGRLRVVAEPVTLAELVDQVMDAMRTYALGAPGVLLRTLDLAQAVGVRAESSDVRERLRTQVRLLADTFAREAVASRDVQLVTERAEQVLAAVPARP